MPTTTVITIRIPKELRERMARIDINWSEKIREFIAETVERYEAMGLVKELRERARKRRVRIDSTMLIRQDREAR